MPDQEAWMKSMVKRFGTEKAVRAHMQKISNTSKRNTTGRGTFAELKQTNPELLKERQRKGGQARWKSKEPETE